MQCSSTDTIAGVRERKEEMMREEEREVRGRRGYSAVEGVGDEEIWVAHLEVVVIPNNCKKRETI